MRSRWLVIWGLVALPLGVSHADSDYDFIVRNARIVDGTGNPWFRGDVGVTDGTIAAVAPSPADRPMPMSACVSPTTMTRLGSTSS